MKQAPLKVLECIRQGQIGGGESHLISLMQNINRNRFSPTVLSFTDGPMIDRMKQLNIPTHVIHSEKAFDAAKWLKVKSWIQAQNFDLVHVHGTRAFTNIYWAARSLKLPIIYTIHGWSFHDDQPALLKKMRLLSERFLTQKATINISVSQSNKDTGSRYFKNFKSVVINNSIDRNRFNPHKLYTDLRRELNIPHDAQVALFIGRFTHQKQPLVLLNAFAIAVKQNPKLFLLMVGDGDQKATALEQLKNMPGKDRILLLPFRQDVPELLHAADFFVLPSLWEGLPIALLEAMAMGKVVIATDVDGTREMIQHKQNGFLIHTDDLCNRLTDALLTLSHNRDLCRSMQAAAQRTVAEGFCAAAMTHQIENVYCKIIHQKTGTLMYPATATAAESMPV